MIAEQVDAALGDRAAFFAALKKRLAEAVYLTVRYDMADEKGETRRERNARFGEETPDVDVPDQGAHVWEWFWELSGRRKTGPEALSFAEVGEWQRLTGQDVLPVEIEMLLSMDDAYLRAVREDQAAVRARVLEKQEPGEVEWISPSLATRWTPAVWSRVPKPWTRMRRAAERAGGAAERLDKEYQSLNRTSQATNRVLGDSEGRYTKIAQQALAYASR